MDLDNLDDAERFQRHFVKPMVDAVRQEIRPVVHDHRALRADVERLKTNQKRALWGLSAAAGIMSVALAAVIDWLKGKLGMK